MSKGRDAIPEAIKRQVRQHCGFGCALCGMPIYDYEHIDPYSKVKEHRADNITLLCVTHHRDVTAGRIAKKTVKSANLSPFNRNNEFTKPSQIGYAEAEGFELLVGDSIHTFRMKEDVVYPIVVIDSVFSLSFVREGDQVLLNLFLYDSRGSPILFIQRGEITLRTRIWDITLIGKKLLLKMSKSDVAVEMLLTPGRVSLLAATMFGPLGSCYEINREFATLKTLGSYNASMIMARGRYEHACLQLSRWGHALTMVTSDGYLRSMSYIESAEGLLKEIDRRWYNPVQLAQILTEVGRNCFGTARAINSKPAFKTAGDAFLAALSAQDNSSKLKRALLKYSAGNCSYKSNFGDVGMDTTEAIGLLEEALNTDESIYFGGHRAMASCILGLTYKVRAFQTSDPVDKENSRRHITYGLNFYTKRAVELGRDDDIHIIPYLERAIVSDEPFPEFYGLI